MTYYGKQRMESFKRAMFAGILNDSPLGKLDEAADSGRQEQSTLAQVFAPLWGTDSAGALVH
jgi:hypothetical protein